jgi:hypothetical protein
MDRRETSAQHFGGGAMNTLPFPKGPALAEHVENIAGASHSAGALVPVPPSLADSAAGIVRLQAEAMSGLSFYASKAIEIGERLRELKPRVKHGGWTDYVTLDCGLSMASAQIYMKLAKHKDEFNQILAANTESSRYLSQAQMLKFLSSAEKRKRKRKPAAVAKK